MARRWLAGLLLVAAVLAVASMWNDSATADEGAHIASGLLALTEGRLDFYATQAPLIEALEAAPVAIAGHRVPAEWTKIGNRPWVVGHLLLYRAGYDPHRILTMARLPVVAMFLALALLVYWFVAETTGSSWAGVAAFSLTAFCPTMLAHGRLATVDVGLALFAFLATVLFLQLLAWPGATVATLAGVAIACTLAAKVSGAIIVPYLLVLLILWTIRTRATRWRYLLLAAVVSVAAFAAIFMLLGRSFDPLFPFLEYLDEIRAVNRFYGDRYVLPQFLLGEFSRGGWPYYNLVALLVKTTIPALVLLFIGAALAFRRPRFEVVAGLLFAILFLAVSAFSSLNLGIRHVLPVLPFLYSAAIIAIHDARRDARESERRVFNAVVAALLGWHAVTAIVAFPSYIAYFNPFIGSHRNADRVLIDSNLDWGQDLRRLAQWTRDHGIDVMRVHYFGAGSVEHEMGDRGARWTAPRQELLPKGWFAVSRHFYRLSFDPTRSPIDYDRYLQASGAEFVTSIGGSIDVYRVR
jgi:hypothetical protein